MTTTTFDTLDYYEKLKAAGVPEQQAKVQSHALAEIIDEKLATKNDILMLQKDILALEERLTYKLTIRMGSMIAASTGILGFLMKFGH